MMDENTMLTGHNPLMPILMLEVLIQQGAPDSVDTRYHRFVIVDLKRSSQLQVKRLFRS
jgi:hypothetical protein